MTTSNGIELVCLDLGRVLIRICDGWEQACALAGVTLPASVGEKTIAGKLQQLAAEHEIGRVSDEVFFQSTAALTGLTANQVKAISNAWLMGAYAGTAELVERLAGAGRTSACLSNTNANHWRMMMAKGGPNALGLGKLTYRFASHLCGLAKPDGSIYEYVEKAAKVKPGAILFFDDHLPNIQAAQRRGWQAIHVQPHDDPPRQVMACLQERGIF
ncbi:MAG: HAD-IA family hydrolase [Phycisphaeraceae bacterium]|nr:HAD-IA family hydrolase [Phycisphaeraceae bacterium]